MPSCGSAQRDEVKLNICSSFAFNKWQQVKCFLSPRQGSQPLKAACLQHGQLGPGDCRAVTDKSCPCRHPLGTCMIKRQNTPFLLLLLWGGESNLGRCFMLGPRESLGRAASIQTSIHVHPQLNSALKLSAVPSRTVGAEEQPRAHQLQGAAGPLDSKPSSTPGSSM